MVGDAPGNDGNWSYGQNQINCSFSRYVYTNNGTINGAFIGAAYRITKPLDDRLLVTYNEKDSDSSGTNNNVFSYSSRFLWNVI